MLESIRREGRAIREPSIDVVPTGENAFVLFAWFVVLLRRGASRLLQFKFAGAGRWAFLTMAIAISRSQPSSELRWA